MNDSPPLFDENNPEEALRYYWQQFRTAFQDAMDGKTWKPTLGVVLVVSIWGAWFFRANWYPVSSLEILKGIAYGLIPGALGLAGYHLAASTVINDPRRRRMYKVLFSFGAVLGALLIVGIENKADREHATEVTGLTDRITFVANQNSTILQNFRGVPLDAQGKEVNRRQAILKLLHNEYVLTHKDVSTALLAGTEEPPSDWVNTQLKQLGETWAVAENVKLPAQTQPPPTTVEVATSYGNLKQRTVDLAELLAELVQYRYAWQKKYQTMSTFSKDGKITQAGWNEWARSNDVNYRHFAADKVKGIHQEFADLHIHDPRLDEILDRDDQNLKEQQELPQMPPQMFYIDIFDIQEIGERLMALANGLPGSVTVTPQLQLPPP